MEGYEKRGQVRGCRSSNRRGVRYLDWGWSRRDGEMWLGFWNRFESLSQPILGMGLLGEAGQKLREMKANS